ncbi:MAG: DNA-primase RepB domain-containing protein [Acidobacteriaceae bacterium]
MPHREAIAPGIAADFLTRSFRAGETIAIVIRRLSPATIVQRIVTLKRALQPRYLSWLAYENATGSSVYFAANPLVSGSRKRTKECVAEVRHVYLDLDTDGEAKLAALRHSNAVPFPTAIVSTSLGKYQVLWRVENIPFEEQETLLKRLAVAFGGDPACTDCNRVLRLPGFLNRKYTPAPLVTVEYTRGSAAHCEDFKLAHPLPYPEPFPGRIEQVQPTGKHSHSEQDWAWILRELAGGRDPVRLTRTLAEKRADKPNPVYYAQRTVDVASAWLWLKDGLPVADVVTMLQVRRRFEVPDKLCCARAHEIAFTAERMIARTKIA